MHIKNYALGKTTYERFSKRASLAATTQEHKEEVEAEEPKYIKKVDDIENEATAELL